MSRKPSNALAYVGFGFIMLGMGWFLVSALWAMWELSTAPTEIPYVCPNHHKWGGVDCPE